MEYSKVNVYGIILASGFSRRMGEQKLLLPWGEQTIFEHVIEAAKQSKLNGIYSVIPSRSKKRKEILAQHNVNPVFNERPHLGMSNSLALGINSLPKNSNAAVILLADQPGIHSTDINAIYNCFSPQALSERVIIQTKYKDNINGHPVLFSKYFFRELSNLKGDVGGKHILEKYNNYVLYTKSLNDYPKDIDTPSDYLSIISKTPFS